MSRIVGVSNDFQVLDLYKWSTLKLYLKIGIEKINFTKSPFLTMRDIFKSGPHHYMNIYIIQFKLTPVLI